MHSLLAAILMTALPPADATTFQATLTAETLEVGSSYSIQLDIQFPKEAVASAAGAPAPFLQIDVPPSVKLLGRTLTTHKELSQNEFVAEPFERLLKDPRAAIPFELIAEPGEGETIGLNLVAYVSLGDGTKPTFVRQRLELPVAPGAKAVPATKPNSNWGTDRRLLQIGDKLEAFALPQADGTAVQVGDRIGKSNLLITTYRAHW